LLHDAQVTATPEGLAVAEAVTVLLPVCSFGVVTLVGLALAGVAVGVIFGWGTVIET